MAKDEIKEQIVIFRAPKTTVRSLDALAKLAGVNRSEVLRRLIPDLRRGRKGSLKCTG